MEGVLWSRKARSRILRGWQKRYFLLTEDGMLKEFAETSAHISGSSSRNSAATSVAASGMVLKQEFDIVEASVKTLPFPLVGRQFAFQISRKGTFRVVLAARSQEEMQQWVSALQRIISLRFLTTNSGAINRSRSPALRSLSSSLSSSSTFRSSPSLELGRLSIDDEFIEVPPLHREDMAKFIYVYEWVNNRVKTTRDITIGGIHIPRGSVLVAANGISLQTLSTEAIQLMLKPSKVPLGLRFLKSPYKVGVLKCKLCCSLSTQLKTMAQYRTGVREWKDRVVEIEGDAITCQRKNESKSNKNKRLIPLTGGCTVKTVHEIVSDRKFCFMVSVKAYSMLFQAKSEEEMRQWTRAIQRAISIAEGSIPGNDRESLDSLRHQSSLNMRNLQSTLEFETLDDVTDGTTDNEWENTSEDASNSPTYPSNESFVNATKSASYLSRKELAEMLVFLQRSGRLVEALQLMGKNTALRSTYWKQIFMWALDPIDPDVYLQMAQNPLTDADNVQVQKDIPRTSKWLAGSPGSPQLSPEENQIRLQHLERVLHAFLSSCALDVRTDERHSVEESNPIATTHGHSTDGSSSSFYMQGMNGLAFILLEVLEDNEVLAYQFFRGIISRILPHVFGICCEGTGRDNFDLFSSLAEVGDILQEVVEIHLPNFHAALDAVGIPVCLLAYKWFPTLFSDISLTAYHSQLRYDTLLVIWDVCLLMGLEGIFCVSLALVSTAEDSVIALGADASAEQISSTVVSVLAQIAPEDLITSVCEVLELCSHPVLLKLRNGHRRRLQIGYATSKKPSTTNDSSQGSSDSLEIASNKTPMTVKDLDSGKLFKISKTGSMLLPVSARSGQRLTDIS